MSHECLLYDVQDRVATVTFNRPEVLNALNAQAVEELGEALARARTDPGVKALILTGAGSKAFVAGADIRLLAGQDIPGGRALSRKGQAVLRGLETMGKPSIAAVNGFALGGGCEVALACSIRYAAASARFGQPEINLGIMPGYGATQRLVRLAGLGRALEALLTGDMIDAGEALRLGLVNKVVPDDTLMAEARALAQKLARKSAPAVELILRAAYGGLEGGIEAGLALESDLFGLCFASRDAREGLRAFLEKREARFEDR
ncbi:MAG: enoyl-CoA hydratase/isomerase family protein [Candidatus Tectomicrobia bacterium]|nr:enoyl-CoA hydratase/isomerase family protein [Candidatus Tectomicrobia bacterium]